MNLIIKKLFFEDNIRHSVFALKSWKEQQNQSRLREVVRRGFSLLLIVPAAWDVTRHICAHIWLPGALCVSIYNIAVRAIGKEQWCRKPKLTFPALLVKTVRLTQSVGFLFLMPVIHALDPARACLLVDEWRLSHYLNTLSTTALTLTNTRAEYEAFRRQQQNVTNQLNVQINNLVETAHRSEQRIQELMRDAGDNRAEIARLQQMITRLSGKVTKLTNTKHQLRKMVVDGCTADRALQEIEKRWRKADPLPMNELIEVVNDFHNQIEPLRENEMMQAHSAFLEHLFQGPSAIMRLKQQEDLYETLLEQIESGEEIAASDPDDDHEVVQLNQFTQGNIERVTQYCRRYLVRLREEISRRSCRLVNTMNGQCNTSTMDVYAKGSVEDQKIKGKEAFTYFDAQLRRVPLMIQASFDQWVRDEYGESYIMLLNRFRALSDQAVVSQTRNNIALGEISLQTMNYKLTWQDENLIAYQAVLTAWKEWKEKKAIADRNFATVPGRQNQIRVQNVTRKLRSSLSERTIQQLGENGNPTLGDLEDYYQYLIAAFQRMKRKWEYEFSKPAKETLIKEDKEIILWRSARIVADYNIVGYPEGSDGFTQYQEEMRHILNKLEPHQLVEDVREGWKLDLTPEEGEMLDRLKKAQIQE